MNLIGIISLISQIMAGGGLFDKLTSLGAGRRKMEPFRIKASVGDRASTTLIWARLQFLIGAVMAIWDQLREPLDEFGGASPIEQIESGGLTLTGILMVVFGAIKAFQRYKTDSAVTTA